MVVIDKSTSSDANGFGAIEKPLEMTSIVNSKYATVLPKPKPNSMPGLCCAFRNVFLVLSYVGALHVRPVTCQIDRALEIQRGFECQHQTMKLNKLKLNFISA